MLCIVGRRSLLVLWDISVSFLTKSGPWYCAPDFCCRSRHGALKDALWMSTRTRSLIGLGFRRKFCVNACIGATMQVSMECASPQQYTGESLAFIHCMVLKIEMFFPIMSSMASCLGDSTLWSIYYRWKVTPTPSIVRLPRWMQGNMECICEKFLKSHHCNQI